MRGLSPGETVTIEIPAKPAWTRTGVALRAAEFYELVAAGRWWDWYIPAGPAGYDSAIKDFLGLNSRLRCPGAKWFALIGAIDENEHQQFAIGKGIAAPWSPPSDGELTCYANDMRGWEWNNRGSVILQIRRVPPIAGH